MSVTNSTGSDVVPNVSDQHCMYDNGAEDSNVSFFNNLKVAAGQTAPAGDPQYTEVQPSSTGGDTCGSDTSEFTLEIPVADSITIGAIDITERWNTYHGSSSNSDLIKANVGNGGDQDRIEVTIVGAGGGLTVVGAGRPPARATASASPSRVERIEVRLPGKVMSPPDGRPGSRRINRRGAVRAG